MINIYIIILAIIGFGISYYIYYGKKPENQMPTKSREVPPRRKVSLTCVNVSKMRLSSSSILSVTTYSRISVARADWSKTLTTPSTFWPMSRLMIFLIVVIALFSCRASCRSSPEQFDREVIAAVWLVHEMELAAALLPGKRERDATLEIAQTSKHLAVANERVQSNCGGDQHC